MKTILLILILFVGKIYYSCPTLGQTSKSGFDTIIVTKIKGKSPIYRFFYHGEREIQYNEIGSALINYKAIPIFRDIGNEILTSITGIGFSTSTDIYRKDSSKIVYNGLDNNWTINLFCEGTTIKNRVREKSEDGNTVVETDEENIFYWDKNASGIIMENTDTIGFFSIRMNPCEVEFLSSWCPVIFPAQQLGNSKKVKVSVSWKPEPDIDYGIIGKLRGTDFYLIRNGVDRKIWIITENIQRCIFQADLDYAGISKKYRISPYILIDPDLSETERSDIFRLSMVGMILNVSLHPGQF